MPGELVKNTDSYHLGTKVLRHKILRLGICISTSTQAKQMWAVHGPQVEKHWSEPKFFSAGSNATINRSCLPIPTSFVIGPTHIVKWQPHCTCNSFDFYPYSLPQLCPHHCFHLQFSFIPTSNFHPCSYLSSRLRSLTISSLRCTFQVRFCGGVCFFKSSHWKAHILKGQILHKISLVQDFNTPGISDLSF